jgi:hypothetical protein
MAKSPTQRVRCETNKGLLSRAGALIGGRVGQKHGAQYKAPTSSQSNLHDASNGPVALGQTMQGPAGYCTLPAHITLTANGIISSSRLSCR